METHAAIGVALCVSGGAAYAYPFVNFVVFVVKDTFVQRESCAAQRTVCAVGFDELKLRTGVYVRAVDDRNHQFTFVYAGAFGGQFPSAGYGGWVVVVNGR